jgi:hypothetical protein
MLYFKFKVLVDKNELYEFLHQRKIKILLPFDNDPYSVYRLMTHYYIREK